MKRSDYIPKATIERLPLYYRCLERFQPMRRMKWFHPGNGRAPGYSAPPRSGKTCPIMGNLAAEVSGIMWKT